MMCLRIGLVLRTIVFLTATVLTAAVCAAPAPVEAQAADSVSKNADDNAAARVPEAPDSAVEGTDKPSLPPKKNARQRAASQVKPVVGGDVVSRTVLRLEQVLASVDRHYPKIAAARYALQEAEAKTLEARGAFDPTLLGKGSLRDGYYSLQRANIELSQQTPFWGTRVYGGYRYGTPDTFGGPYPTYYEDQTLSNGELRIGMEVPLLRNGFTDRFRTARRQGLIKIEAQAQKLEAIKLDARRQATDAYWKWVSAWYKVEIASELLELAKTRQTQVELEVDSGNRPRLDVIDNRRIVLERFRDWSDAKRKLQQAVYYLSLYFRDRAGRPRVVVARPVQLTSLPGLARSPLPKASCHPEIAALERLLAEQEAEVALAANDLMPDLAFQLEANQDMGRGPDSLRGTTVFGKLSLKLPLLLRKGRGKHGAAKARYNAMAAELRLAEDTIGARLQAELENLYWYKRSADYDSEFVEVARQVAAGERERFNAGASDLVQLNIRERNLAKAKTQYLQSATAYLSASWNWKLNMKSFGNRSGCRSAASKRGRRSLK